ncbi:MAG: hypothetical protein IPG25_16125 [Proteobacteria bacterium]|nr:hypothetical protein [Pseudomonadota bacterium]MBP7609221.1 hypothetical protein [Steroidobacteraceae bacterium]MCZ2157513.1 hypothetical protein [Bryobacterales bacterium]
MNVGIKSGSSCGQCNKALGKWFAAFKRDDGFCSQECRNTFDVTRSEPAEASRFISSFLEQIAPREKWLAVALCRWGAAETGNQTVSLWVGRALFGIGGDLLNASGGSSIAVVGISENRTFALAPLGYLSSELVPGILHRKSVDKESSVNSPLDRIVVSQGRANRLIVKNEDRRHVWELEFPKCFVDRNDEFPVLHKDLWYVDARVATEEGAGDSGIAAGAVRAAIEAASRGPAADAAKCFGNIPSKALNTAIERYAPEAAGEEVFALVPSDGSGKSGFVLTNKALYFRSIVHSNRYRFAYDDVVDIAKTKTLLRIATAQEALEWDLESGKELLWERSRRNAAEFVAAVLQAVLRVPV